MTNDYVNELRAAGYSDAQIAKEAAYLERVARETAEIRDSRDWNYGLHHAGDD